MSGFSAASLSDLDFDFTGIPRDDGQGNCSGKGSIPEPSSSRIQAFYDAVSEMQAGDAVAMRSEEAIARQRQIVADLCGGCPSVEQVAELPPRAIMAFVTWLLEKLANPKA